MVIAYGSMYQFFRYFFKPLQKRFSEKDNSVSRNGTLENYSQNKSIRKLKFQEFKYVK